MDIHFSCGDAVTLLDDMSVAPDVYGFDKDLLCGLQLQERTVCGVISSVIVNATYSSDSTFVDLCDVDFIIHRYGVDGFERHTIPAVWLRKFEKLSVNSEQQMTLSSFINDF